MKEMIDIEVELSKHAEALSGLHQSIRSGDMIVRFASQSVCAGVSK